MLNTNIFHLLTFARRFGPEVLRSSSYYTRNIEYPLCFNKLELEEGLRILDIGSGHSVFPLYLAWRNILTYAVDIDEYILELKELARRFSLGYLLDTGRMNIQICDVRKLNFSDNFFDRISAISTLEHIPGDGDIKAMQEIRRVLKSGGRVFVSIEANIKFIEFYTKHKFYFGYPYLSEYIKSTNNQRCSFANSYDKFMKNKKLYSLGFVRYYNKEAIFDRLINPSGLVLEEIGYYANRYLSYRMFFDESFLSRFISIVTPFIAHLTFKKLDSEEELNNLNTLPKYLSNAIAYVILRK